MFRNRCVFGILVVICIISLSACGGGSKGKSRPSPTRKSAQKKPAKPALPPQFSSIETNALKLYTGFTDWNEARTLQSAIKSDWTQLKGELTKAKTPPDKQAAVQTQLNGIDTGITAKDRFKVAEQANELIGALQGLTDKYQTKTPPEVMMLQTDLREIRLHATGGNWTILQDLSKKAQQDWKKLKPKTKTVGGDELGRNIESYFKELDAAIKAKDANKCLQILGHLESDMNTLRTSFETQPKQQQSQGGSQSGGEKGSQKGNQSGGQKGSQKKQGS